MHQVRASDSTPVDSTFFPCLVYSDVRRIPQSRRVIFFFFFLFEKTSRPRYLFQRARKNGILSSAVLHFKKRPRLKYLDCTDDYYSRLIKFQISTATHCVCNPPSLTRLGEVTDTYGDRRKKLFLHIIVVFYWQSLMPSWARQYWIDSRYSVINYYKHKLDRRGNVTRACVSDISFFRARFIVADQSITYHCTSRYT